MTPFVQVYTKGVVDVNYIRYTFGYLVIIGEMLFVLRSPYEALVNAAGHYKQTKKYAFTEAGINLFLSILMVRQYGLVGVVVGTIIAILFRNLAYGSYVSQEIIHRDLIVFVKRFLVTGLTVISISLISRFLPKPEMTTYWNWVVYAVMVTLLSIVLTVFFNYIFFRNDMFQMLKKVVSILKRVGKK